MACRVHLQPQSLYALPGPSAVEVSRKPTDAAATDEDIISAVMRSGAAHLLLPLLWRLMLSQEAGD